MSVDRTNKACKYYPCHKNLEDCTFCNCPFYACGNKRRGKYITNVEGKLIWDCSKCTWINEFWKARIYWRTNLNKGYLDEQEYTIYRDLHCWILEFTYDLRPYQDNKTITDQIFWFALRLKAFPDQPLGLRRSYSRTRAGEPGDPGFYERQSVGFSR